MAFTATEQALYDFAKSSLPGWFFTVPRAEEVLGAFVKIFDAARQVIADNADRTLIENATGIWLDLHALDRGTYRQDGETDEALRARIRNVEDAVSRPALLAATEAILAADGVLDPPSMVEVKRDGAFLGQFSPQTGTGGTFTDLGGGLFSFEPDTPFQAPVEVGFERSGAQGNPRLTIAGAADPANDGTFEVTALEGNAVVFSNVGAAGADAAASWTLAKYDVEGNSREGRARAYLSRGYRLRKQRPPTVILILPYGTTAGVEASVRDMIRTKKAAGVVAFIERRTSP